jgi:RNA polymerase sigma-70 factor (ECF subfamily)
MDVFPSPPDEDGSLELITRCRAGERDAWNELYRRYHDQLLFAVRARLGGKLRACLQSEDVFQSVALDALTALQRFEYRGPGSLERFLRTMVVNKIRDRADTFGAQKRSGAVPLSEVAPPAAQDTSAQVEYFECETYDRLERALADLPDDAREVVLMRKVDGYSSKEVAEATGRSDAAVRKVYSRAIAQLALAMDTGGG